MIPLRKKIHDAPILKTKTATEAGIITMVSVSLARATKPQTAKTFDMSNTETKFIP